MFLLVHHIRHFQHVCHSFRFFKHPTILFDVCWRPFFSTDVLCFDYWLWKRTEKMNWSIKAANIEAGLTYIRYSSYVSCTSTRQKQMFNVNRFHSPPSTSVHGGCSHRANKWPNMNCQTTNVHDILMTTEHVIQCKDTTHVRVCVCVCAFVFSLSMVHTQALIHWFTVFRTQGWIFFPFHF